MSVFVRSLVLLIALMQSGFAAAGPLAPQRDSIEPPQNILFVGNSFTYYNNSLHDHLRELMKAGAREVGTMRAWTLSGAQLREHEAGFAAMASSVEWDVVILQGHSLEAIQPETFANFQKAARNYHRIIREAGADTAFFMTWAYTDRPEFTAKLDLSYTMTGNSLNALVVPVGLAFAEATEQHPNIPLRTPDKLHPTLAGTYLAACTFYAAFFKESPEGLSYTADLPKETGEKLQSIAWHTTTAYYAR